MKREPWYESDNPGRVVRGGSWRLGVVIIGVVVFFAVLGVAIWGVKVLVSGPKGAGDQEVIVNDAKNRIFAQQHFFTLYNQVLAYDQQLDQAAADKADHPGDQFFATNYSGLVKSCIDARNQYNGDANKVTMQRWLDPELPFQLTVDNPKTDCKEAHE